MSAFSQYFNELTGPPKSRYLEKISCIRNIDPYTLCGGSKDKRNFPNVTILDIVHYLVYQKSSYTKDEFKAFKSLEAYKNFRAGYLKNLECHKINEYCVLLTRVTHSQRIKIAPTKTWIVCKSSGEVISAHCDCVAGLGEVCSHVATTLFAVEDTVRKYSEGPSVTDTSAYWMPPAVSLGTMSSVSDIRYTENWDEGEPEEVTYPHIPEPDDEKKKAFLQELHAQENCAIFSVVEPFCRRRDDSCALVKCLYNSEYESKSLAELIEIGKAIKLQIMDTTAIEKLTKGQHLNKKWHELREGRITASLFKQVTRTGVISPSMSLLKRICYPSSVSFKSAAMTYGCKHEKDAIERYKSFMNVKHTGFKIWETGLIVNNDYPCLGASPDSMIECECCGKGVLEIKCPFCAREGDLTKEILALKSSFLTLSVCGSENYSLSKHHAYFYQMQMQMALAKVSFGDFFVWNHNQFLYERLYFDSEFWQENVAKALSYHQNVVMPEILGRFFTNLNK